jgi:F-type H+-transporting ATPase subunit b
MPQIDQISEIFASQLFWLIITFGLIYVVVGLGMLPKIEATIDARDQRIAEDLQGAERARAAADETEAAYRQRTEQNRAEAFKVTQAAKEASARKAEKRVKVADDKIAARVEAAEVRIRAAAKAAMGEIEAVAVEATQEIVARLSGAAVSREQAAEAVRKAMVDG